MNEAASVEGLEGSPFDSSELHVNPDPAIAGDAITLTLSGTGTAGPPTGTVKFFINKKLVATVPVKNGVASYTSAPPFYRHLCRDRDLFWRFTVPGVYQRC